jgi:ferredoxin
MSQVVDINDKYLIILLSMSEDTSADVAVVATEEVVVEINRKATSATYRAGDTLLEAARSAGLSPPSSCETGSCGTCMGRLTEGSARMNNNDALEDDEVAEGWVLTCQALPTSRTVRVVYE